MIVDSSALVAIARREPEAPAFSAAIAAASAFMSAGTWLETAIVVDNAVDPANRRRFDDVMRILDIQVMPVTVEQARLARQAYRDFGRGSGHPAGLNFGDCFAYALAADTGQPLLFKGDDFGHTDVIPVLPPPN